MFHLFITTGVLLSQSLFANAYGGSSDELAYSVIQTSDGGFALSGWTGSFGAGSYDFLVVKLSSNGSLQWAKTFGGTDWDEAYSITQTLDGGLAVAGWTGSFGAGNDDFLVVKMASDGSLQWAKTFGGTDWDEAYSITQTLDGGLAVAGWTGSFGAGNDDFLVVKMASDGSLQWAKTFGGPNWDEAYSITQTLDGGFAVAGGTYSFGAGIYDFLVVKLASNGSLQWAKTFGGTDWDEAYSITQTLDGGLVVAGYTESFGAGSYDFLVVKLASDGTLQWVRTFGGTDNEGVYSITQTLDGGLVLAGYTYSFGAGDYDFLVLKLAPDGSIQWVKTFGGPNADRGRSVTQTSDGGCVVAGETESFGAGNDDFLVVKLSSDGNLVWAKILSETDYYGAQSVTQTLDGGLAVAGWTGSFGAGNQDFLLLKMGPDGEYTGCLYGCAPNETTPSLVENSPSLDVADCTPTVSDPTVQTSDPTVLIDTVCSYVNLSETRRPSRLPGISCSMFQRGLVFQSAYEADLRIYSVDGRLVRSLRLEQGQNRITLDKGVYLWQAGPYKGKAVVR